MLSEELIDRLYRECMLYQNGVTPSGLRRIIKAVSPHIEQAVIAELLAGVEMPEAHVKSGNPAARRPWYVYYTADQLRTAIARAKLQQREADAKVCEGYALRTRGYLDDDMTACKLADTIRKGGE